MAGRPDTHTHKKENTRPAEEEEGQGQGQAIRVAGTPASLRGARRTFERGGFAEAGPEGGQVGGHGGQARGQRRVPLGLAREGRPLHKRLHARGGDGQLGVKGLPLFQLGVEVAQVADARVGG